MSAADFVSYAAVLKRLYPQTDIQRVLYENAPLYAMLPKKTDMYGETVTLALQYATTQGRSAVFQSAKAYKTPSKLAKFLIGHANEYSLYSVDGKTLRVTSNSKGSIIKALENEVDSALKAWKRATAVAVYRNGGGSLGAVGSFTSTTVTLANANDVVNFEVGAWIDFSVDDGSVSLPAGVRSGGPIQITAVNRNTGVITFASTSSIIGLANSDSMFMTGDYSAKIKGLAAWLPAADPTPGDSFFGLDRSADPLRLGGIRVPATGLNPEEALQKGAQQVYRNGGKPSHCFMNDADFLNLQISLGTNRAVITQERGAAINNVQIGVEFEGIKVAGPAGPIKVFADPQCPQGTVYMLQLDTWSLRGAGEFPFIDATDGNKMLREDAADAFEGRIIGYFQMMCDAPGYNARISL